MSNILEILGKGLKGNLLQQLLPGFGVLEKSEAQHLQQLVKERPFDTSVRLRLGVHLALSAAVDAAEEIFSETLRLDPNHVETLTARAALAALQGDWSEAVTLFQESQKSYPHDGRLHFGLGCCFERQGLYQRAGEHYRRAYTLDTRFSAAAQRMAAISLMQNSIPDVISHFLALRDEEPECVWNYLMLGQLHLHARQYEEAANKFERGITIEPDNFAAHDDYIESLQETGCYSDAIEELNRKIAEEGEFPDSYVRLGDMFVQLQDDEAALDHYHKALEIYPDYIEAVIKLGTQHLRMERLLDAASQFNRAVELNDRLIAAYAGLGVAQLLGGRMAAGADTLDLAQALEPNSNLLFAEVARLQLKLALHHKSPFDAESTSVYGGMPEQERDNLLCLQLERHRQSLMQNPNHADLHYRYALLLRCRGKYDEAIRHYQNALEVNPSFQKARLKLGLALWEKGKKEKGLKELQEGLSIHPEYIDLHYRLGLMYSDPIQFALAVEHFRQELASGDNATVQENLDLALQNMGLVDRCQATWEAVCQLDPTSPMAFLSQRTMHQFKTVR